MFSPIQAYKLFFTRFFSITGRSSRSEYWWLIILELILFILAGALIEIIWPDPREHFASFASDDEYNQAVFIHAILNQVFLLIISLFFLTLNIRRLHDIGLSGWWLFITAVPMLGGLLFLIAMLLPSQHKTNKFGQDPTVNKQQHYQYYMSKLDRAQGALGAFSDPQNPMFHP